MLVFVSPDKTFDGDMPLTLTLDSEHGLLPICYDEAGLDISSEGIHTLGVEKLDLLNDILSCDLE